MYTLHRDNLKSNKGHRDILQYCVFFMVFAMLSLLCSAACYSAYAARKWLKSLKCITNFDDDWFWDKLAQILCSNLWSEGLKSAFSDDDNGWRRKRFPWIQDQPRYQWPEYAQHFIKQRNTVVSFSNSRGANNNCLFFSFSSLFAEPPTAKETFLDFRLFDFCDFWFNVVYNSILFSSSLVLCTKQPRFTRFLLLLFFVH